MYPVAKVPLNKKTSETIDEARNMCFFLHKTYNMKKTDTFQYKHNTSNLYFGFYFLIQNTFMHWVDDYA